MAITDTILTRARRMAITGLTGLLVACSSVRGRGITATGAVDGVADGAMAVAGVMDAPAGATADVAGADVATDTVAVGMPAARSAVVAIAVRLIVDRRFMGRHHVDRPAAASMAAVDTAVADTGNRISGDRSLSSNLMTGRSPENELR